MFTATLSTIAKGQKQPKCPSTDKWDKQNALYAKNGRLFSLKKEGNSDTAITQINIEDIMLSEGSQSQKNKNYMIPLI